MDNPVARLSQVILESAMNLTKKCEAQGLKISSLDDQRNGHAPFFDETMALDTTKIISAAQELLAVINPAELYVFNMAQGSLRSAALRVAIQMHVADILREGDQKGVHVDQIARISNVDSTKLARVLRLLASNNIFQEVNPNVFVNNRLSRVLDSGQSVSTLLSFPEMKFDRQDTVALAWIDHLTDNVAKASAYLTESLKEPTRTALPKLLQRLDSRVAYPEWRTEEMRDVYKMRNLARRGFGSAISHWGADTFFEALALKGENTDARVVGIGVESGQIVCELAAVHRNMSFVIYDQLSDGPKKVLEMWNADPHQVKTGRIEVLGDAKALENATVFIVPFVLWSDEYCLKQLTELRGAAAKDTLLVIGSPLFTDSARSDAPPEIPMDLLSRKMIPMENPPMNETWFGFDVGLMAWPNGRFRSFRSLNELLEKTGWKVTQIHNSFVYAALQAIPV